MRLLAYITGTVNQRLLQCGYLAAENRILRSQLPARLRLSDEQRSTLAEIGKRLGRKYLAEGACIAKPAAILAWYRRLIAQKFDGSKQRSYPGRPRIRAVVAKASAAYLDSTRVRLDILTLRGRLWRTMGNWRLAVV